MSEEHRQAMMRYLDATYACRDVARLLREAQEALEALCGARAVQVYLRRSGEYYRLRQMPDGAYRMEDEPAPCEETGAWRAPLRAQCEAQDYGVLRVEGALAVPPEAKRLCETLGEQLYAALNANGMNLLLDGSRLAPKDGYLPAQTLAALAHEVRAPLATALSGLAVLRRREEESARAPVPEVRALYEAMERSLRRSLRVSNNLLLAASGGALVCRREWFDVPGLLVEIAQSVQPFARQRGVRLDIVCGEETANAGMMVSSRQYLESIAINLLSNAVRHANADDGHVTMTVERSGDRLTLTVRDNGAGFADADREKLFEKFWRGDEKREQCRLGAGLGLYIVRTLAQELGGAVEAENDGGAVFRVTLPVCTEGEGPVQLSAASAPLNCWNTVENEFLSWE